MKKTFTLIFPLAIALSSLAQTTVDAITGAAYANDVYYSFENGSMLTQQRNDWDIAFATDRYDISVLANHGAGVEVYAYPLGTISDWVTVDTSNIGSWPQIYNSIYNWSEGAFAISVDPTNQFDFAWGVYNPVNHHIVGDSLFVVRTISGILKKFWIVEKNPLSGANTWEFKYANIDGTNEQTVVLQGDDYLSKNFVHYSLDNDQVVEREPSSNSWELLFTKYYDYTIPYNVTGVLANSYRVSLLEVFGVDQATFENAAETDFNDTINLIGSDWKEFNMGTMSYDLDSNRVYFAKVMDNDGADSTYWKLYFTGFTGMSEGKYTFVQKKLSSTLSIDNEVSHAFVQVFPNPANDVLNIVVDNQGTTNISVFDMSGRRVLHQTDQIGGFDKLALNVSALNKGIYVVEVSTGDTTVQRKFSKI